MLTSLCWHHEVQPTAATVHERHVIGHAAENGTVYTHAMFSVCYRTWCVVMSSETDMILGLPFEALLHYLCVEVTDEELQCGIHWPCFTIGIDCNLQTLARPSRLSHASLPCSMCVFVHADSFETWGCQLGSNRSYNKCSYFHTVHDSQSCSSLPERMQACSTTSAMHNDIQFWCRCMSVRWVPGAQLYTCMTVVNYIHYYIYACWYIYAC